MIEFLTFTHVALLLIIGMITIVWIWLIESQKECVHYLKDIKQYQREMSLNITTVHNRLCPKEALDILNIKYPSMKDLLMKDITAHMIDS